MNIKGDITGGLTAGVVALPLCLAFGIASGLGAPAGLYGAICLSFFAAIFGGTKTQISGPTGPMCVVTASVIVALNGDLAMVASVFVLAGVFQMLFGACRLGGLVRYIPYSVTSGFMNGIGLIIILLQIGPFLGGPSPKGTVDAITSLGTYAVNWQSAMLGVLALVIIFVTPKSLPRLTKIIPAPLLALLVLTPIAWALNMDVATIGEVPHGLPEFHIPTLEFSKLGIIIGYALTLAFLGSIDSLLTSLVADSLTKTKHNSNRELIGQGIGNALCGFVGGLVGAGATMRTVTNIKLGGTGRLSGVVSSLFLLTVLLVLSDVVKYVPLSVLSGILVKVGIDIFDYRFLREWKLAPRQDLLIVLVVFVLTVFWDLIAAVIVGVIIAMGSLVYRSMKSSEMVHTFHGDTVVCEAQGDFDFCSSAKFAHEISSRNAKALIVDLTNLKIVDLSGIYTLEDELVTKQQSGMPVAVVAPRGMNLMNLPQAIGETNMFESVEAAIAAMQK